MKQVLFENFPSYVYVSLIKPTENQLLNYCKTADKCTENIYRNNISAAALKTGEKMCKQVFLSLRDTVIRLHGCS